MRLLLDIMDLDLSSLSPLYEQSSQLYDRAYSDYRKAAIIPALILLFAVAVLGAGYVTDGPALEKGIDFTGGTSVQILVPSNVTVEQVQNAYDEEGIDATVRTMSSDDTGQWIVIDSQETVEQSEVEQLLDRNNIPYEGDISIRTLGAAVGGAFFQEAVLWSGVALLIMSTVIFVAFRSIVPSMAVIFAALTDILFAMAGMSLLGIPLTLGSLAALLMLLGYSVDTDILLSTRVLRQHKQDMKERIKESILTGSTMTLAAVVAFTALYTVSTSPVLDQIATVIIIGLLADLPITWLGNTAILRWYVEQR